VPSGDDDDDDDDDDDNVDVVDGGGGADDGKQHLDCSYRDRGDGQMVHDDGFQLHIHQRFVLVF